MKTVTRGKLIAASAALVMVGVWMLWHPGSAAGGVGPSPFIWASGLVGVTVGQSVQLNVTRIPSPTPGPPPEDVPIAIELSFFDADGNVLLSTQKRVSKGRTVSLILDRDTLGTRAGTRLGIRAGAAAVSIERGDTSTNDIFAATFEVFDNATGKTTIVMGIPPDDNMPSAGR